MLSLSGNRMYVCSRAWKEKLPAPAPSGFCTVKAVDKALIEAIAMDTAEL